MRPPGDDFTNSMAVAPSGPGDAHVNTKSRQSPVYLVIGLVRPEF